MCHCRLIVDLVRTDFAARVFHFLGDLVGGFLLAQTFAEAAAGQAAGEVAVRVGVYAKRLQREKSVECFQVT